MTTAREAIANDLKRTHAPIFALQTEMKEDAKFRALCIENGLPWDFAAGYEPRGYNGPRFDFQAEFRKLLEGHGVGYDERYVWD
jgi:hypothetical protein